MAAKEEFNVGPRIYGPSGQLIFAHDTGIRSKELIYDPPRHLRLLIVCVAAAECSPFAQPALVLRDGWRCFRLQLLRYYQSVVVCDQKLFAIPFDCCCDEPEVDGGEDQNSLSGEINVRH